MKGITEDQIKEYGLHLKERPCWSWTDCYSKGCDSSLLCQAPLKRYRPQVPLQTVTSQLHMKFCFAKLRTGTTTTLPLQFPSQVQVCPLLLLCDLITNLAGSKSALRAQTQTLKRNIFAASWILAMTFSLSSSSGFLVVIRPSTTFCPEIPSQAVQNRRILHRHTPKAVHLHAPVQTHNLPRNRMDRWWKCRMIVATADVGSDDHIFRPVLQRKIVDFQKLCLYFLNIKPQRLISLLCSRSYNRAPGTVIQLQVTAARCIKLPDHILVCLSDILDQLLIGRIKFLVCSIFCGTIICWYICAGAGIVYFATVCASSNCFKNLKYSTNGCAFAFTLPTR